MQRFTLDNEDAICQIEALERAKAQLLRQLDAANQAQFQAVTTLDNHQGRMQELEHTLATERELHSQLKSAAREGLQWWSHAGAKGSKPVAVGGAKLFELEALLMMAPEVSHKIT